MFFTLILLLFVTPSKNKMHSFRTIVLRVVILWQRRKQVRVSRQRIRSCALGVYRRKTEALGICEGIACNPVICARKNAKKAQMTVIFIAKTVGTNVSLPFLFFKRLSPPPTTHPYFVYLFDLISLAICLFLTSEIIAVPQRSLVVKTLDTFPHVLYKPLDVIHFRNLNLPKNTTRNE